MDGTYHPLQSVFVVCTFTKSSAHVDQQFRPIGTDQANEWNQAVLRLNDVNVCLCHRAFSHSSYHVGEDGHLLRVELKVVESIETLQRASPLQRSDSHDFCEIPLKPS